MNKILIQTKGQFNEGIFVKNEILTKLTKYNQESFQNLYSKLGPNILFPVVHSITKKNDVFKIKMEKFDGDLTDFLFDLVAMKVISAMNTDSTTKEDIWFIFRGMIPKTSPDADNLQLPSDRSIFDSFQQNSVAKNASEEKEFEKMNNISRKLSGSGLTKSIYDSFIRNFTTEVINVLPLLQKQVLSLKRDLFQYGYKYRDDKLDNFVYKILDEKPSSTFFMYDEKYIVVRMIDWDSGLTKTEDTIFDDNDDIVHYGIHGQYSLRGSIGQSLLFQFKDYPDMYMVNRHDPVVHEKIRTLLNLNNEIFNIIFDDYFLNLR